ncbi:spore maturation protein A [Intestinibacillus sp. Marseille-P6563]|uniref:spore maturation protein A n=1 Tax=Intestinibacillus sp. Marseille-P6563 TaxID=2364792 RepID=UPI000F0527B2|nr:spore maturation protein A [Intestinibacillus sp. Marseille-P6563]
MLSKLWVGFFCISLLCGTLTGRLDAVSSAAAEGATAAVELILKIAGLMCLWSGVMEVVSESGLASKIEACLRPLLQKLFGRAVRDRKAMELVSANVTANLLGLSNAATPIGLRAVSRLYESAGRQGTPDSILTLIILNTASIQLIPSTVAAVRASYGAAQPFDIMPAVWCASVCSVGIVLLMARALRPFFPDGGK